MVHKIAEIKDLDPEIEQKLIAANITTVEQLLTAVETASKRAVLVQQLGVKPSQLTNWVNRADLMRLKGVGTEMANLLEECGVDSCKELQHRVAANLYAKLKTINDMRKITHHAPTLPQVEEWIREAATLAV